MQYSDGHVGTIIDYRPGGGGEWLSVSGLIFFALLL